MSLTRDEWAQMWESIKTIEYTHNKTIISTYSECSCHLCQTMRKEVKFIKDKIQQVIGQME